MLPNHRQVLRALMKGNHAGTSCPMMLRFALGARSHTGIVWRRWCLCRRSCFPHLIVRPPCSPCLACSSPDHFPCFEWSAGRWVATQLRVTAYGLELVDEQGEAVHRWRM